MIDGVTYNILTKVENTIGSDVGDLGDDKYDVLVPRLKKMPSKVSFQTYYQSFLLDEVCRFCVHYNNMFNFGSFILISGIEVYKKHQ